MTDEELTKLNHDWKFWGRPKQLAPEGNWANWVLRAGRGFGKTRTGSGWVNERAAAQQRWIALVAKNPADARDYMVEGPAGILKNSPPWFMPEYQPSKRRISWPNGSWATIYSDEEPEQQRGFSGDTAWLDEFAKFRNAQVGWDNLSLGMREASADRPRKLITTTPKPMKVLRVIEQMKSTVTVWGTSYENKGNLDPDWFRETVDEYAKTRLGRQEVFAQYLDDVPGALWTSGMLNRDGFRVHSLPMMKRIVVGVDPSGTKGDDRSDKVGIVVCGLGVNDIFYILGDYTMQGSPKDWGAKVVWAYHRYMADAIIAEINFGGHMVEHVILTADNNVPVKVVHASRGKIARAEPIASLYERGRVCHYGFHGDLEEQMMGFTTNGYEGGASPDNVDAMVWAMTELAVGSLAGTRAFSAELLM